MFEKPIHKAISTAQRKMKLNKRNLEGVSANRNILDNIKIMKDVGGVSRNKIAELAREAKKFSKTLK